MRPDEFVRELEVLKEDFEQMAYRSWRESKVEEDFYKGVTQGIEMAKRTYERSLNEETTRFGRR